jgi:CHAT domain-containing protein
MYKSLYLALWVGLWSILNLFQSQPQSPQQLWDAYFESIQSRPTKILEELEAPILAAREMAIASPNNSQALELTVLLMLVYNNQGKFSRSYELYSTLEKEYPNWLKQDPILYKAYQYLGYHSNSRVNRKQDLPFLRTIAGTFGESSRIHHLFQALSLDLLGRTLYDQNQYLEAIEKLLEANAIIQKEKLRGFLGGNFTMLGIVYDAREEYRKAIEFYEDSNQILESLNPPPYGSMAVNAYNIGLIYLDRFGEVLKSVPYYEKALEYDRKDGGDKSPYLADDYRSLANVYYRLFDFEQSELYIKRSIEHYLAYSYDENPSLATAYLHAAKLESQKKQFESALEYVKKAIYIYELNKAKNKTDIRRWLAGAFNIQGEIALKMGNTVSAIQSYQSAEQISIDLDRTIYLMEAYRGLIRAQLAQKRPDEAYLTYLKWDKIIDEKLHDAPRYIFERRVTKGEIVFDQEPNSFSYSEIDLLISDLSTQNGMSDLYLRSLHLKTKALLSNPNGSSNDYVLSHLDQYHKALIDEYNGKNGPSNREQFNIAMKPAIVDLLQLCFVKNQSEQNRNYIEKAFYFMEIHKSTSLMEGLSLYKDQLSGDLPAELREEERTLEANRHALLLKIQALVRQNNSDTSPLLEAYFNYERLSNQMDSLQAFLKEQHPTYIALSHIDANLHLNDVVDTLEPDQTLIAYLMAPSQAFALVISKDTQMLYSLNDATRLTDDLIQYRTNIIERHTLQATHLTQEIIPTNIDSLSNLIIIPDGVLNGVPFETLLYQGKPLVQQATISYRSGFRFPFVARSKGWKWHGFAPVYTQDPLPYNREEIEKISKIAGGRSFVASKANKEAFLRHAPKATIIHLATHGQINEANPTASSILFGDDPSQELSVLEIYGLKLNGTLAVLSACNTGWTNSDIGNGWMSVSRAFAFAGVQSTLMSLWEVPDRETSIIMEAFYTYLRAGIPKDEALQKAKTDYLAQTNDPALQHPYYWAGFVLSGDTTAYVPNPPIWLWFIPFLVILALVYLRQYEMRRVQTAKSRVD